MATKRAVRKPRLVLGDEGDVVEIEPLTPAVTKKPKKVITKPKAEAESSSYTKPVMKQPAKQAEPVTKYTKGNWQNEIKRTIESILSPFMKNTSKYTDEKAMKNWVKAFTHETVDPYNNYEVFEHYGDLVLKCLFTKYLLTIFPGLKVHEYAIMQNNYQDRKPQGQMADKLGFIKLLRVNERAIQDMEKVRGDVFESFFGALFTIGDEITDGLGAAVCYNTIVSIYENVEISTERSKQDPKTIYTQIFQRHGFRRGMEEIYNNNDNSIHLRVLVPYDANTFLKNNGIDIGNGTVLMAEGVGYNKKVLTNKVYQEALDRLKEFGVTPEWSGSLKKNKDLTTSDRVLLDKATLKAKENDFSDIYFGMDNKVKTARVYQLRGFTSGGKDVLLSNYKAEPTETEVEGRNGALRSYIDS